MKLHKYVGFGINVLILSTGSLVQANNIDQLIVKFKESYVQMAFLNYQEAANTVGELEEKVEALIDGATQENLELAKQAWLESRISYGQSEVFRFADGPIDGTNSKGEEGPEGLINAWPLNEAYIDYVKDNLKAGIIQDQSIKIDEDMLVKNNQHDDEADVSTGYHAIEFLLWGQDFNPNGPGSRPHTDYVKNNPINDRRGKYLEKTTELLMKDLSGVVVQWEAGKDNYRKTFLTLDNKEILTRVLTSLATLSGFELSSERIATALDSGDQEDEHSCFSDNTHIDFIMNAKGIDNVYFGTYGSYQGTGLDQIAKAVDSKLAQQIEDQLAITRNLVTLIKPPIDQILVSAKDAEGRKNLEALVESLQEQAKLFQQLGIKLGLTVAIKNS